MEHATKALTGFTIKNAELGEVTAIVSTFDVVDRDGDVVLPGAIRDGTVVKLSGYDHDVITKGMPPAGKGVVRVVGNQAVLEGKYFMDTQRGREAFAVVRELGPDSEWSIGYLKKVRTAPMTKAWAAQGARRLIAELDLLESSPVFMGANALTATLGTKAQADGVDDETATIDPAVLAIAQKVADQMAAEQKAAADAAAEAARVEAETKAAAEAKAQAAADAARRAAEFEVVQRIHERFVRNMRRAG
jgi:hypothetical protein